MNRKNLELLGLSEPATAEEITSAYESLRAKYMEERFLDGEAGNNAARMLTRIETAYSELQAELAESAATEDGGSSFAKVEEYLRSGNTQEAQRVLDTFDERNAQWHYLQSVVFYRKNWMNESKKQLEIAINLDPNNDKYKDAYRKLNERLAYGAQNAQGTQNGENPQGGYNQGAYQGQNMNQGGNDQMGGNACSQCLECCYTYLCISCLCDGCCR